MNCSQPGCTGLIVDGYCDLCGMAPPRPDAAAAPPRPTRPPPRPDPTPSPPRRAPPRAGSRSPRSAPPGAQPRPVRAPASAGGSAPAWSRFHPCPIATRPTPCSATPPSSPRAGASAGCDEPVGRGRDGAPGRTAGFCRKCGRPSRSSPSCAPASSSPGSTRWSGASPTAGWDGSTWPATATCPTGGWCSRGCSTPATAMRWRRRWPSAASWPRSSTRTS